VNGNELGKTYNCKTPGCVNESRSSVGRHAYCPSCQERRAREAPAAVGGVGDFVQRVNSLKTLATAVDRARAKAKHATQAALKAEAAADAAEQQLRAAVRDLGQERV
jgi:hypothetical protein